ncbi:MAG: hypothetical protein M9934_09435 [Thermomicrobiales bacterium]|nr:hypothetical protein [Thermomicrobiales bacterium]
MILTPDILYDREEIRFCFPSARQWQAEVVHSGTLPLIGVAGTRGKSTVLRLVEAVMRSLRFQIATWTDLGVQIGGRNQRAELAGWGRALQRLAEGTIDVALQELDWAAVNVAGLPDQMYPVMIHTGLGEQDTSSTRTRMGIAGTYRCARATHHNGIIVANGDDFTSADILSESDASLILVSRSLESPLMRRHLEHDGLAVWVENDNIWVGSRNGAQRFGNIRDFPITFDGAADFNIKNLLLAIGALHAIGVDLPPIQREFKRFRMAWSILPASMNLYEYNDARAVIDQLAPAWVLRDVLKVLNPGGARRQIVVVGDLGWLEKDEVYEVGRSLGRYRGAIVIHGDQDEERLAEFKRGLANNPYPPLLSSLPTERRAINRAFKALRPTDVLIILTTRDSSAAHRAVRRHIANFEKISS